MVRAIPKETVDKMVQLYSEGVSIVEIAERLGVNKTTVHKYLNKRGVKKVSEYDSVQAGSRLTGRQKAEILKRYKRGDAIADISKAVDVTVDTIYRHIRKEGLSRGVSEDLIQEAIRLHLEQHMTAKEVIEKTGISQASFYRNLKKYKEERGG